MKYIYLFSFVYILFSCNKDNNKVTTCKCYEEHSKIDTYTNSYGGIGVHWVYDYKTPEKTDFCSNAHDWRDIDNSHRFKTVCK